MVGLGFIGAGRVAGLHADALAQIPDARIVAVTDRNPDRSQAFAAQYGGRTYPSYEAMLDHEPLDAVYICTPTLAHVEHALAACRHKLPFFIEKPVCLDMTEAWRVYQAVEAAGVMTCVGFHWRYVDAVRRAEEILAGRPLALVAAEWLWSRSPILWLRDRDQGGGQVVDQATHLTDLCQWFAGPVRQVYAAYTLNTFTEAEFHNWDGYALTFKHAGGAVGSVRCTYALYPEILDVQPPHVDLVAREMFLRISERGLLVATPAGCREYLQEGEFHGPLNRAFVAALATGDPAPIRTSIPASIHSLALTLAANASAAQGCPIDLDQFMEVSRV